jgi:hypothetical protein
MDLRRVAFVTLFASSLFACSSADTSPAKAPPSNVDEDDGDVVDGQRTTSGQASLLAPPPAFRDPPTTRALQSATR